MILIQPNLTWLLGTDEMYFNSSSRDGRRKSRRQGTRDESRVAECDLLHDFDNRSSEIGFFLSGHETATLSPKT